MERKTPIELADLIIRTEHEFVGWVGDVLTDEDDEEINKILKGSGKSKEELKADPEMFYNDLKRSASSTILANSSFSLQLAIIRNETQPWHFILNFKKREAGWTVLDVIQIIQRYDNIKWIDYFELEKVENNVIYINAHHK
jgi:hypothetical protein